MVLKRVNINLIEWDHNAVYKDAVYRNQATEVLL